MKIIPGAIAAVAVLALTGCGFIPAPNPTPTASGVPSISMSEAPKPSATKPSKTPTTKPTAKTDTALMAACSGVAGIIAQTAKSPTYTLTIAANDVRDLVKAGTPSVKKTFASVAEKFRAFAKSKPGSADFTRAAKAMTKAVAAASRQCVAAGADSLL